MHTFIKMQTSAQMNLPFQQQAHHVANHPNFPAISEQNDNAKNGIMHTIVKTQNRNSPAIAVD
jgi:hypothetical protein